MTESTVKISMRDENAFNCSYAIVTKGTITILLILKDCECAIYDYHDLKAAKESCRYLLLKHYKNSSDAYTDFLKLIGKMCKKRSDSKYFLCRKQEDNRIISEDLEHNHMIRDEERDTYRERLIEFEEFVLQVKNEL